MTKPTFAVITSDGKTVRSGLTLKVAKTLKQQLGKGARLVVEKA